MYRPAALLRPSTLPLVVLGEVRILLRTSPWRGFGDPPNVQIQIEIANFFRKFVDMKLCVQNGIKTSRHPDKNMAGKFITWGFTLNNYTEQELCMIRSFPEFIRECVWELEKGEDEGTPHVQGYCRLKTQQRMSFLSKHFLARAHYTGLTTDEYKLNMKAYAQKQDVTATSAVVQSRQDSPILFPAVIPEMVVEQLIQLESQGYYSLDDSWFHQGNRIAFDDIYTVAAKILVQQFRIETLVMRPDVKSSVRLFYKEISQRIKQTRNANEEVNEEESRSAAEVDEAKADCCDEDSATNNSG